MQTSARPFMSLPCFLCLLGGLNFLREGKLSTRPCFFHLLCQRLRHSMSLPCHGEPPILRVASISSRDASTTLALALLQDPASLLSPKTNHPPLQITLLWLGIYRIRVFCFPLEEPYCGDLFFWYISIFIAKFFFLRKMWRCQLIKCQQPLLRKPCHISTMSVEHNIS